MAPDKKKVSPRGSDEEIKVRELTELRQDTTEKAQKALESRMAHFDKIRDNPVQAQVENVLSKVINGVAELSQSVRKLVPEETQKKMTEMWAKLMLAF
jgi:hypothetical protein